MQTLRITKDQEERIRKLSNKINMIRIKAGKEVLKDSEIAKYLLDKALEDEEGKTNKIKSHALAI